MSEIIKTLLKSPYFLAYLISTVLFFIASRFETVSQPLKLSFEEALQLIYLEYPESHDNGNSQKFFSEQINDTWYISIAYIDSKNRMIGGDCFRVTGTDVVYINSVKIESVNATKINPVTCTAK